MNRPSAPLLSALALLAALPACTPATPHVDADAPNIVIVSFDTLRADRMGLYGNDDWNRSPSPAADALGARGVTFDAFFAPRGQTHPSIASMLTGKYPATHGVRENANSFGDGHEVLWELLQRGGMQTGVFVANFDATTQDKWVYRGADVHADGFRGKFRQQAGANESAFQWVWDNNVEASAHAFLDQVDTSRPFALWVHFYDIHKPYNPPPEYVGHFPADERLPKYLVDPGPGSGPNLESHLANITLSDRAVSDEELSAVFGLYDATLASTDARLQRLLGKLAALGEADDTLVMLTADHGEELYDRHRYFFHGASIYNGTVRIPFVAAGPGIPAGARLDQVAQNIDIAPTVLDAVGLPVPDDMEGASLLPLLRGDTAEPPHPYAVIEWQDLIFAITDGRHVYIDNRNKIWPRKPPYYRKPKQYPDAPAGLPMDCFEAYDLVADPGQQRNLLKGLDPERLEADPTALPPAILPLRRALEAWLRDPNHRARMDTRMSDERIEQLKQLGYVGGGSERHDAHKVEVCPK